jgi:hypothetical protein
MAIPIQSEEKERGMDVIRRLKFLIQICYTSWNTLALQERRRTQEHWNPFLLSALEMRIFEMVSESIGE